MSVAEESRGEGKQRSGGGLKGGREQDGPQVNDRIGWTIRGEGKKWQTRVWKSGEKWKKWEGEGDDGQESRGKEEKKEVVDRGVK